MSLIVPSNFLSCLRQVLTAEPELTLRRVRFLGRKLMSSMKVLHIHSGHWMRLLMWSSRQHVSQREWPQKMSRRGTWVVWLN